MNWWKNLKGKVKRAEALSKHTSFRIGGKADFFIEPEDIEDLKVLLKHAGKNKLRLLFIGSGSNILAKDTDIKKIVVHLNSGNFAKVKFENNYCKLRTSSALIIFLPSILGHAVLTKMSMSEKSSKELTSIKSGFNFSIAWSYVILTNTFGQEANRAMVSGTNP